VKTYKSLRFLLLFVLCSTSFLSFGQNDPNDPNDLFLDKNSLELKSKKRLIPRGAHILTLALSNNTYPLIINDPSLLLASEISRKITDPFVQYADALYINYQFTLPHHFFVESGFKYLKHWTYFRTNEWVAKHYYNISGFSTLSFSLGTGYRIVGDNNLRFFDLHTGFTLGIADNPIGNGDAFSNAIEYIDNNGQAGVLSYAWQYQIISKYSLGFYLGVSKDIRLTKNLYATARYHYQFGKNSQLTEHQISYDVPTLNLYNTVRGGNSAKGQMIAIGLRWLFDK
jgi:hypothetical protein